MNGKKGRQKELGNRCAHWSSWKVLNGNRQKDAEKKWESDVHIFKFEDIMEKTERCWKGLKR